MQRWEFNEGRRCWMKDIVGYFYARLRNPTSVQRGTHVRLQENYCSVQHAPHSEWPFGPESDKM